MVRLGILLFLSSSSFGKLSYGMALFEYNEEVLNVINAQQKVIVDVLEREFGDIKLMHGFGRVLHLDFDCFKKTSFRLYFATDDVIRAKMFNYIEGSDKYIEVFGEFSWGDPDLFGRLVEFFRMGK